MTKKGGGADMSKVKSDKEKKLKNLPRGLQIDTTTSAYGDAGRGRSVPKFKVDKKRNGGMSRGGGAAIKGINFKGVF